jgi:dihydrofolate reductase
MSKLILFNMMTLDGFVAGPENEIDWHHVDAEFNDFAIDQLDKAGGLVFGRVTYLGMMSWWPTPQAIANDPIIAGKMNSIPKYVFSRTLKSADWNNTRLFKDNAVAEMAALKKQQPKDLYIFGSANLAGTFRATGLIDEYRLMLNPVAIRRGMPMFTGGAERIELKLLGARPFKSGNVLLTYAPA